MVKSPLQPFYEKQVNFKVDHERKDSIWQRKESVKDFIVLFC